MHLFLIAFQLASAPTPPKSTRDSVRMVDRVRAVEGQYFLQWRRDFAESEIKRRGRTHEHPDTLRQLALSCTNPEIFGAADSTRTPGSPMLRPVSAATEGMLTYFGTVKHP